MDLIIYRFWDHKWTEAHHLTQKDVALLVDKSNKLIYIYEGLYATPQKQIDAKAMLGSIKIQYPEYKFRLIGMGTPQDITLKLEDVLKDTQEIQNHLSHNKNQLELAMRICGGLATGMLTILLIFISIRFFDPMLWQIIKNKTDVPPGSGVVIDDRINPSLWFQNMSFLIYVIMVFIIFLVVIAGTYHRYKKWGFFITALVVLIFLINIIWQSGMEELLSHSISLPVYFYTFLISTILIMIAMTLVILGLYIQKVQIPSLIIKKKQPNSNSTETKLEPNPTPISK